MDGLSAAASIIAVIQISSEIFDLCRTYYLNVKEARQDIDRLRNEVASLQDVLVHVVDLTNDPNASSSPTLDLINRENGPLKQCQLLLEELATKLDPGDSTNKVTLALKTLKWPFKSKEIDKTLIAMGRYKASVVLSLATDQMYVNCFSNSSFDL
jgi:ribosome biogenesis GTPase A